MLVTGEVPEIRFPEPGCIVCTYSRIQKGQSYHPSREEETGKSIQNLSHMISSGAVCAQICLHMSMHV